MLSFFSASSRSSSTGSIDSPLMYMDSKSRCRDSSDCSPAPSADIRRPIFGGTPSPPPAAKSTPVKKKRKHKPSRAGKTAPKKADGKIPRPQNAFMLWQKEIRPIVQQKCPQFQNMMVSQMLGANWHKMEESDRTPKYIQAEECKRRHAINYPEYKYSPKKHSTSNSSNTPSRNGSKKSTPQPSTPKRRAGKEPTSRCSTPAYKSLAKDFENCTKPGTKRGPHKSKLAQGDNVYSSAFRDWNGGSYAFDDLINQSTSVVKAEKRSDVGTQRAVVVEPPVSLFDEESTNIHPSSTSDNTTATLDSCEYDHTEVDRWLSEIRLDHSLLHSDTCVPRITPPPTVPNIEQPLLVVSDAPYDAKTSPSCASSSSSASSSSPISCIPSASHHFEDPEPFNNTEFRSILFDLMTEKVPSQAQAHTSIESPTHTDPLDFIVPSPTSSLSSSPTHSLGDLTYLSNLNDKTSCSADSFLDNQFLRSPDSLFA